MNEADCRRLLSHWSDARLESVRTPQMGASNILRVLTTGRGRYVLRLRPASERQRQERETDLVRLLATRGIPVVEPLATASGARLVTDGGHVAMLLPFVPDRQPRRRDLTEAEIGAMGVFLATLHRCLEDVPAGTIPARRVRLERRHAMAEIDRLLQAIAARRSDDPTDRMAARRLASQRSWLEGRPEGEDLTELDGLPWQVVHGDYQETNLFFRGDEVSAIIDWDNVCIVPRVWEVARVLHFVCSFEADRSGTFLEGYRSVLPLADAELDVGVRCYGLMRAYDLWMYRAIYDDGRQRLRRFLNPRPFTPVVDSWVQLRRTWLISRS